VIARATGFSWQVALPVAQADEINTTFVKETNHGRQEMGSGSISAVFSLSFSDELPTENTIRSDEEYEILEVTGDDHPMTNAITNTPTILTAFIGVRFVNLSSAIQINQTKMLNVEVVFRKRQNGFEYVAQHTNAFQYPAIDAKA